MLSTDLLHVYNRHMFDLQCTSRFYYYTHT
jgi:hypothetical protein